MLDGATAEKLKAFTKGGGKILAAGTSGLYADGSGFAFDLGAEFNGECEYNPAYIRPEF